MRRLLQLAPWLALGVLVWRQDSLERSVTRFVAEANTAIQATGRHIDTAISTAIEHAMSGAGSQN